MERHIIMLQPYDGYGTPTYGKALALNSHVIRADCGHLTWITQAAQNRVDQGDSTICVSCSVTVPAADVKLMPGVLDHIEVALGAQLADRLRKRCDRLGIRELEE